MPITYLPLHDGKAPRWLFSRMVALGRAISEIIIDEYGADEYIRMLSDSNWFQALACTLGYDWHSSGTTTVTVAALKEALKDNDKIVVAGGKGKAGTNTPNDIVAGADRLNMPNADELVNYSRIAAKVDAGLVYDNISIYHHSFIFSKNRKWAVIQQAMQSDTGMAIRFQWLSDVVNIRDIASEPHTGIQSKLRQQSLDLTFNANAWSRQKSIDVLQDYQHIYPKRHEILNADISPRAWKMLSAASSLDVSNYNELLLQNGVGRAVLRSLAIISSLIYNRELAYHDPVAYAYNLGGKDGIPFRINKNTYDAVIQALSSAIDSANIDSKEKYLCLRRLNSAISMQNGTGNTV